MAKRNDRTVYGKSRITFHPESIGLVKGEHVPTRPLNTNYPPLETTPADLLEETPSYKQQLQCKAEILQGFSSSNYYLREDDKKGPGLNFDWNYFPLEVRPTSKRKAKDGYLLELAAKKTAVSFDALFQKLEKEEVEKAVKKEIPLDEMESKEEMDPDEKEKETTVEDEEEEEFDDEELDIGNDYSQNYFDAGEDYLDEDEDLDEGPCFT